jgi:IS6 family transposase
MGAHRPSSTPVLRPAFVGFRFPSEVFILAVRWYLRLGLSYRDLEELLAERGIEVDHVTIYRWVQRFTPLLADAARLCRHRVGARWQVDETYVKVAFPELGARSSVAIRVLVEFGRALEPQLTGSQSILEDGYDQAATGRGWCDNAAHLKEPGSVSNRLAGRPVVVGDVLWGEPHVAQRFLIA